MEVQYVTMRNSTYNEMYSINSIITVETIDNQDTPGALSQYWLSEECLLELFSSVQDL